MEDEPLPVRRPSFHTDQRSAELCESHRTAAVGPCDPDLRRTGTRRYKGDLLSVRRELRQLIRPGGRDEQFRLGWRFSLSRYSGSPNVRVLADLGVNQESAGREPCRPVLQRNRDSQWIPIGCVDHVQVVSAVRTVRCHIQDSLSVREPSRVHGPHLLCCQAPRLSGPLIVRVQGRDVYFTRAKAMEPAERKCASVRREGRRMISKGSWFAGNLPGIAGGRKKVDAFGEIARFPMRSGKSKRHPATMTTIRPSP